MTFAPEAPALVVVPATARCRSRSGRPRVGTLRTTATVLPGGHVDRIVIVEAVSEAPLAELRTARITEKATWVLNGVGEFGFSVSAFDPGIDALLDEDSIDDGAGVLKLIGREVQWWRDGLHMWSGVPVAAKVSLDGTVDVSCFDLGYYLTRKVFGAAERRDLLGGAGSFDRAGLPGWIRVGGLTAERDTSVKARGAGSAKLTGVGAIQASYRHPVTTVPGNLPIHLTGVSRLPGSTPKGTAVATLEVRDLDGVLKDSASVVVDDSTALGSWWRWSFYALLPPDEQHDVTAVLWSASTSPTRHDDVRLLKNDTTGYVAPGRDLTVHGVAAINHIQRGAGQAPGFGFRTRVVTQAGTVEPLGVRHAAHQQITDFLQGYTDRVDGFDWWIDHATRRFCVAHRRGNDHETVVLHERAIAAGEWMHDETDLASKVIVLGTGDGPDRPEGGYQDTSRTRGLVLDHVHQPPDETPLAALDPTAEQLWEQKTQPQVNPFPLTCSADLLPVLNPGDRIPVQARVGRVRLPSRTWVRISQIAFDADTDTLELT